MRCEVSTNISSFPRIFVVLCMPVVLHYVSLMCDSSLHLRQRMLLLSVIMRVQMASRAWIVALGGVLVAFRPYNPILCFIQAKGLFSVLSSKSPFSAVSMQYIQTTFQVTRLEVSNILY